MKLIRYEDHSGQIHYAAEQPSGSYLRVEGDPFRIQSITREGAKIRKILAPVTPVIFW